MHVLACVTPHQIKLLNTDKKLGDIIKKVVVSKAVQWVVANCWDMIYLQGNDNFIIM